MYILTVVLLMFLLPIGSILLEVLFFKSSGLTMALIGKWFVFWGAGARLFLAGLRQFFNPKFTAVKIFDLKTDEPLVIVKELGIANVSMGLLGLLILLNANWVVPSAIVGAAFYGFAGINHVVRKGKNLKEQVATYSDIIMFIILFVYVVRTV